MKAIILAAGRSSRLYPLTLEKPKCLLKVQGKRIIDRQINALKEVGIQDILMVVGYKTSVIQKELGNVVRYRTYVDFEKTNNLNTLWSIRDELKTDCLCLFSDLLFEVNLLRKVLRSRDDLCMVIDTSRVLEGTMRVKMENEKLIGIGSQIPVSEGSGNFIGMAKFSKEGCAILLNQMEKMVQDYQQDYYTLAVDFLARQGQNISFVDIRDQFWAEIDTQKDLKDLEKNFKI